MIESYRPSLEEIEGKVPWSAAEERLLEACGTGEFAWFGNERPTEGRDENTIRAGLIRHILLGGCDKVQVHAKGVQIQGGWVTDVLDLQACESSLDLFLKDCHICERPNLRDARLGSVTLPGSEVPGLDAHRLKVTRDVLLSAKFKSKGTVNLISAEIGGALSCSDGTFDGAGGEALNCDAMTVGADVFLRGGFTATGQVDLTGASIKGQLDCSNGSFDAEEYIALNCDAMVVGADVFLSDGFTAAGQVNLAGHVSRGSLIVVMASLIDRTISRWHVMR